MKKVKQVITPLSIAQAMGGKILHTKAQKASIQILCERPIGMSMEEYKMLRRKQTKAIKNVLR